jgi:hypothetical protein
MRILSMSLMTCLGAYYMSAAWADEPKLQALSAVQSAQAPATPAAADSSKAAEDARNKALLAQGYKPEIKNGTTYYCRREAQLGSHFETKVCGTPDQLRANQQDTKDVMDKIQREQPGPAGK